MSRPAVFLDKDGTLVDNVPYNVDPAQVRLRPRALEGLHRLAESGFALIVVSNQPGVALGLFEEPALRGVRRRLEELLGADQLRLDGFYYCPHHAEARRPALRRICSCRKPAPGLLLQAAREHGVSLQESWMVGDILDDVEAGRRSGCRTILIDAGHETEWMLTPMRMPHFVVHDLAQAARVIVPARFAGDRTITPVVA